VKRKIETRNLSACELRAGAEKEFCIAGVAARYNVPAKIGGQFTERIQRGAFARSLKSKSDVFATYNHNENFLLGRTTAGTLTLNDAADGLHFKVQLDRKSQTHRDIYSSVQRGDLSACSFSFVVPANGDTWAGNSRTLTDVDLREIAVVVSPAYSGTSAVARSRKDDDTEPDEDSDDEPEERACACTCAECADGRCDECSDTDCDDEGCTDCPQKPDPDETDDLRARLAAVKI
jgi:HK97 family phage prohead protease